MTEKERESGPTEAKETLKASYGRLAKGLENQMLGCCAGSTLGESVPRERPDPSEAGTGCGSAAPPFSLGCGDPTALARIRPGQTVLDLGSGPGMDCFHAAVLVGEQGRVIGVDMTPEMVSRARAHAEALGTKNVEFRLGEMERLPLPDESVDAALSNCAVNLAPSLPDVFREVFRVLKPGGTMALSEIMLDRPMPEALRAALPEDVASLSLHDLEAYRSALEAAGFGDLEIDTQDLAPGPPDAPPPGGVIGENHARPLARMAVRIGETGETLAEMELDALADLAEAPRSIRGNILARKPAREGARVPSGRGLRSSGGKMKGMDQEQ